MNASQLSASVRNGAIRAPIALAAAMTFLLPAASAAVVEFGAASSFAVLAGSAISNTGTTTINGDVGSSPTPTITGFESVILNGVNHAGDGVTATAKSNLSSAYDDLAGMASNTTLVGAYELNGATLIPGIYHAPISIGITGMLTLDAGGNADAFWVFKVGSTLTTASNATVKLTGGAKAENIIWQVGSSATLGTGTVFVGTIVARESITANTGSTVLGRLLALDGAVTLQGNTISVPEPGSALLLGLGVVGIIRRRRRSC